MSLGLNYNQSPFIDPATYYDSWAINYGTVVTLTTGFVLMIDANPKRVSLFFSAQQQQAILWGIKNGAINTDGLRMNTGGDSHTFCLSLSQHGGIAQQAIWVAGANATAIRINYLETLWVPKG